MSSHSRPHFKLFHSYQLCRTYVNDCFRKLFAMVKNLKIIFYVILSELVASRMTYLPHAISFCFFQRDIKDLVKLEPS